MWCYGPLYPFADQLDGIRKCRLMKVALLSFDAKEVEIQVSTDRAQTGSG
jgi:hypothetical protein